MAPPEPLFTPDDHGRLVPSAHTIGPWDRRHQHGGAVAALVAREAERLAGPAFAVTRLTLDLVRPLPLAPLEVAGETIKPGRRVEGFDIEVYDGDDVVARARAVTVRLADLPTGEVPGDGRGPAPGPGPEEGRIMGFASDAARRAAAAHRAQGDGVAPAFHATGMEVRVVEGAFDAPGPARAWFRLRRPVVAGEEPSGLQRALAAADFGNGLSWVLPFERWVFVNADLTVHLARPPEGEWIALDARTLLSDRGTALAESVLYDRSGRLGRAVQSLVIQRRDGA